MELESLGESEDFDLAVADDHTAYGYPSYNDGFLSDCNLASHHPTDAVVRMTFLPCYADCNCDRKVDLADLVIMKGEFLRTDCATNPCNADCNYDNSVDLSDLVMMKGEFFRSNCPACQ
jgi:hypothetical protein